VGPLVLSGIVTDPSGRPVANARVAVAAAPVEVADIAALTGEDGRFSFGVPVVGAYRVEAFADEGYGAETVDLEPDRSVTVRVVLRTEG